MKILIEQGGYHQKNMGDLVMLQVAIARLTSLWPDAELTVFTKSPPLLAEYCPGTRPLAPTGRNLWNGQLLVRAYRVSHAWGSVEDSLRKTFPSLARSLTRFKFRQDSEKIRELDAFWEAIHTADLVIATGGGYVTSSFQKSALDALKTLEFAKQLGKTTAMVGQGLGPFTDAVLKGKAKQVLPNVDLLALREQRVGIPLLQSLGSTLDHVVVTGDDAIEAAYKARPDILGQAIGVNLRVAQYSSIDPAIVGNIRSALHKAGHALGVPLLPVPIDHHCFPGYADPDSATIQKLLEGFDDTTDGGASLDTPLKVIHQAGQCRVVVTGSYHAGVFALSQGIPVIGLAKSEYYIDKFMGLANQFGTGCEVLLLSEPQLADKLENRIRTLWAQAETLRPALLDAAQSQMNLAQDAYKRIYQLVSDR